MTGYRSHAKDPTVLVNLEGCVASWRWRQHYAQEGNWDAFFQSAALDLPYREVASVINGLREDIRVLVLTARPQADVRDAELWLQRYGIRYDEVFGIYLYQTSPEALDKLKYTAWTSRIKPAGNVRFVFESNPACYEMWRAQGLACQFIEDPELEPDLDPGTVLGAIATCGKPVTAHAVCGRAKDHTGECSAMTEAAYQMAFAPHAPTPVATALPGIDAICGKEDATGICIRDPHHVGECYFVAGKGGMTEAEAYAADYGMWGGYC